MQRDREHLWSARPRRAGDIGQDHALYPEPVERSVVGGHGLTQRVLATCHATAATRKNAPVNQARLAFPHEERSGSPSKTRTCDNPVNSRTLYQLSYRGTF